MDWTPDSHPPLAADQAHPAPTFRFGDDLAEEVFASTSGVAADAVIHGLEVMPILDVPARLVLRGDFDSHDMAVFDAALDEVLRDAEPSELVLDLTELEFLGSMGLTGLLRARSLVDHATTRGCRPSVRRTLEMAGIDRFFDFTAPTEPVTGVESSR